MVDISGQRDGYTHALQRSSGQGGQNVGYQWIERRLYTRSRVDRMLDISGQRDGYTHALQRSSGQGRQNDGYQWIERWLYTRSMVDRMLDISGQRDGYTHALGQIECWILVDRETAIHTVYRDHLVRVDRMLDISGQRDGYTHALGQIECWILVDRVTAIHTLYRDHLVRVDRMMDISGQRDGYTHALGQIECWILVDRETAIHTLQGRQNVGYQWIERRLYTRSTEIIWSGQIECWILVDRETAIHTLLGRQNVGYQWIERRLYTRSRVDRMLDISGQRDGYTHALQRSSGQGRQNDGYQWIERRLYTRFRVDRMLDISGQRDGYTHALQRFWSGQIECWILVDRETAIHTLQGRQNVGYQWIERWLYTRSRVDRMLDIWIERRLYTGSRVDRMLDISGQRDGYTHALGQIECWILVDRETAIHRLQGRQNDGYQWIERWLYTRSRIDRMLDISGQRDGYTHDLGQIECWILVDREMAIHTLQGRQNVGYQWIERQLYTRSTEIIWSGQIECWILVDRETAIHTLQGRQNVGYQWIERRLYTRFRVDRMLDISGQRDGYTHALGQIECWILVDRETAIHTLQGRQNVGYQWIERRLYTRSTEIIWSGQIECWILVDRETAIHTLQGRQNVGYQWIERRLYTRSRIDRMLDISGQREGYTHALGQIECWILVDRETAIHTLQGRQNVGYQWIERRLYTRFRVDRMLDISGQRDGYTHALGQIECWILVDREKAIHTLYRDHLVRVDRMLDISGQREGYTHALGQIECWILVDRETAIHTLYRDHLVRVDRMLDISGQRDGYTHALQRSSGQGRQNVGYQWIERRLYTRSTEII